MFWFVVAIVFFILWVTKSSKKPESTDQYGKGYWDGYRALGDHIREELVSEEISRDRIQQWVGVGHGAPPPPTSGAPQAFRDPVVTPTETSVVSDTTTQTMQQPAVVAVPVSPSLQPSVPTRDMWEAVHRRKTLTRLNVMLYMASFLLVAAVAAFIATSAPASVRLSGIIVVTVVFYITGLTLYRYVETLRPAAVAFAGTALAIIPFFSAALHQLAGVSETSAWVIMSIIGVVSYLLATIVLRSQVVSYLTMAFVLSLASSTVASASLPILWYFIVLISISLVANMVAYVRPGWLPELFRKPMETTGQLITPVALIASLFISDRMDVLSYEIVYGVATMHYIVAYIQQRNRLFDVISRVLAHVTLLIIGWDIAGGSSFNLTNLSSEVAVLFGLAWLCVAVLQFAYSIARVRVENDTSRQVEVVWIVGVMTLIAVGQIFWLSSETPAQYVTLSLSTLVVIATVAAMRLRMVWWFTVAAAVSVPLAFVAMRWWIEPSLPWSALSVLFGTLAGGATIVLLLWQRPEANVVRSMIRSVAAIYTATLFSVGLLAFDSTVSGWTFAVVAAIVASLSYSEKYVELERLSGVAMVLAIGFWIAGTSVETSWKPLLVPVVSSVALALISVVHNLRREERRRDGMFGLATVVGAGIIAVMLSGSEVVVHTGVVLLILATFGMYGLRLIAARKGLSLLSISKVSYVSYGALLWLMGYGVASWWVVLIYVVITILAYLASHTEQIKQLVIIGNITLYVTVMMMWELLYLDRAWAVFGQAWIVSAVLYALYWAYRALHDMWRSWASLASVWAILLWPILVYFFGETDFALASYGTLFASAMMMVIQGYLDRRLGLIETGLYIATLASQMATELLIPQINAVFYAHWWAITIGLYGLWRRPAGGFTARAVMAMSILSVGVGLVALDSGGLYTLLFLVEHLALLVVGVLRGKSWAVWWGVIASVASVVYFLRDFVFLWLGFLGLVLIAIVVWRLLRLGRKDT